MRLNVHSQPAQKAIREGVAPLFFALGNVAAVTKELNEALSDAQKEPALHANRLHTLLSDDLSRGLNESTLDLISRACELAIERNPELTKSADQQLEGLRNEAVRRGLRGAPETAKALGLPPGIARLVVTAEPVPKAAPVESTRPDPLSEPDWSYQDVAVSRCVAALTRRKDARIGLILPTGAGKTRTALRTVLTILGKHEEPGAMAVWVTHRKNLREQAFRELQKMIANRVPETLAFEAAELIERVRFQMVSEFGKTPPAPDAPPVALIIIDEAHHAAAPSYQQVLDEHFNAPVLLLTATPNRPDSLPIGMDEIAYTITHKELAERGAVLRPEFLDLEVEDFKWSPESVDELADYVVGHTRNQFHKVLVLAPRVERVKDFYAALTKRLSEETDHPLLPADVGYVVGAGNSLDIENEDFLARFSVKARAVIISAQLLLEGFDDPSIDTVVLTYPSGSVIRLMQAAGRAVRYSPGKRKAYVVQAKNTDLAYHFDERWLYQDIDDYLRPKLLDFDYANSVELRTLVEQVLREHRASAVTVQRVLEGLQSIAPGDTCRLFLYGLPYFGTPDAFDNSAKWGALLEAPENSLSVRCIFNDFCALGADLADATDFLTKEGKKFNLSPAPSRDGLWRDLMGLLLSSYLAKQEMAKGDSAAAAENRPYRRAASSTWLRYVTFTYRPAVPAALSAFLADCYNATAIETAYLDAPTDWFTAIKVPLPLDRYEAHLLRERSSVELREATHQLRALLADTPPERQFGELAGYLATARSMVEPRVFNRIEFLLTPSAWLRQVLPLNQPVESSHG